MPASASDDLGERVAVLEGSVTEVLETVRRVDTRTEAMARVEGKIDGYLAEHGRIHDDLRKLIEAVQGEIKQEHDAHTVLKRDLRWIQAGVGALVLGVLLPLVVIVLGPIVTRILSGSSS